MTPGMTPSVRQSTAFAPHTEAAGSAREATRHFLDEAVLQGHRVSNRAAGDAMLIASELVTNALRHTDGPCTLDLALRDDDLDIDVTDTSPSPPERRPPHTDGTGGWGWILITCLAHDTAVVPTPTGGKTVHVRLTDTCAP